MESWRCQECKSSAAPGFLKVHTVYRRAEQRAPHAALTLTHRPILLKISWRNVENLGGGGVRIRGGDGSESNFGGGGGREGREGWE